MKRRTTNALPALLLSSLIALASPTTPAYAVSKEALLKLYPTVLQFNSAGVGSNSTPTSYPGPQVLNLNSTPVTISGFSISGGNASDFSVSPGSCPISPQSLQPDYNCLPNLSFIPSAVGLRSSTLSIRVAGGATQQGALVGEGLKALKALSFSVPELAFPDAPLGLPPQLAPFASLAIQNTGSLPLNIQSVLPSGSARGDFSISIDACSSTTLPPGGSCSLGISFAPTAVGTRQAALKVTSDAKGGPTQLPLIGVGSAAENTVDLFPVAIVFPPVGTAGNASAPVPVFITNTGSKPVKVAGFLFEGPNASDFSIPSNNNFCQPLPYTLTAQASCQVDVQFQPAAVGTRVATFDIFDSAAGSQQTIPLEGLGLPSTVHLGFIPSPIGAGMQNVGAGNSGYFYIANQGTDGAQVSVTLQGPNSGDFSLPYPYDCGYLNGGESCYEYYQFSPSAPGIRQATVIATDSITGQSQSTLLIGSGIPSGSPLTPSVPGFSPQVKGTTSAPQYSSIFNYSSSPVTITGIKLSGADKSDFRVVGTTCPPGSVIYPYNNSCSLTLTFTPEASGIRTAEIDISYAGGTVATIVPLAALGVPPSRVISFNPLQLDMGAQRVGDVSSNAANVVNAATEPVNIQSITITGPGANDYAIIGNQCPQGAPLAPGAGCQVSVQFTPSKVGARRAFLSVTDDAYGNPQNLPLAGFGTSLAPVLEIQTTVLNFNAQPLRSPAQNNVGVFNPSHLTATISGVQITGPNAADFHTVNNCRSPLFYYTSCTISVVFTPSATGLRTAQLQIHDDAEASPQIIPLAGLGVNATRSVSVSPAPVVFQNALALGYSDFINVTITNSGQEDLHLSGFHLSGVGAHDFGIQSDSCPFSPLRMPPGYNCSIQVTFMPSKTGVRLAVLNVTSDAQGGPQSIALAGEGLPVVKQVDISPGSVSFTPTPVGSTDFQGGRVDIINSGTIPLTLQSTSFGGPNAADFSFDLNNCNIGYAMPPGTYCPIYLNFTPSSTGTRSGDLIIKSDAGSAPFKVKLTGTGE